MTFGHCEVTWFPIHVLKIMCQNWDPTSWKSHLKSFQVSVLETASVKIQAPNLRSQVLKTMSWKPYPKISQVFLGLGNPECKLQVSKNWGSHVLKIMSLKIPCWGFGEPPQCKQTPGGQKLRQLKTPQRTGSDWKNLPSTAHNTDRHCCFNILDFLKNRTGNEIASFCSCVEPKPFPNFPGIHPIFWALSSVLFAIGCTLAY